MSVAWAKAAVLVATVAMIVIRAPHGQRSRTVKVARSRRGRLEAALLTLAWIGFFLPPIWTFSRVFSFADYPLHPAAFGAGVLLLAAGLWLLHRSHVDLGTNWSVTLEVREGHSLVTGGVYRRVRHPMYTALFLFSIGMALVLPNWVAGPAYLATFGLLYALRVGAEERMMRETFGREYDDYRARTTRLVPGLF